MSRTDRIVAELHATRAELLDELARVDRALILLNDDTNPPPPPRLQLRDLIVAALRQRTDATSVAEIYEAARALGWVSSSDRPRNVVASTVSKLARAGEIERVGDDSYRLHEARSEEPVLV